MGQNEETLSTHPGRSETKKVTDKEPTRPVRNTRTWMKTTSYGKTKQHLFVGLLLGVIVLSTQAQALSIVQPPICCSAHNAKCESCKQGISEEEYCRKNPRNFLGTPGCEKYQNGGGSKPAACCRANNAKCLSCAKGMSEEEYCKMKPFTGGCEKYRGCCKAFTAECLSCTEGIREEDYCKKNPSTAGCEKYRGCCKANNAQCLSCAAGLSEKDYCKKNPSTSGCEKYRNCCQAYNADCLACSEGKSVERFCKKKRNRDVPGCEKKGCCKANTADCLACSKGKSVKRFCKKYKNRDVPGCEKYHRRGSLARRTGMTAVSKRTGMTAASKRTGASSVGFFDNCLADDLGSISTVPFGCLLLSLPIRVALGVPFWRGFLGIHFKSM